MGAVLFGFLMAYFTHYSGVCDVPPAVSGYSMVVDGAEDVSALDVLFSGVGGVGAYALAEATKFICRGCIPCGFVFGVTAPLLVFQGLPCVLI